MVLYRSLGCFSPILEDEQGRGAIAHVFGRVVTASRVWCVETKRGEPTTHLIVGGSWIGVIGCLLFGGYCGLIVIMKDISLSCECGKIQGTAINISPQTVNRVVCYCDSCQAFATYLGAEKILDSFGGTDICQVTPAQIKIMKGAELLRSLRLSPDGLFRWYAGCCNTPIANTISESIPFVGLIHSFIDDSLNREELLGPVKYYIFGKFAKGNPPEKTYNKAPASLIARNLARILWARVRGLNQPSPFFLPTGAPVSEPHILEETQI